jgi:aminomethyltransferase
VGVVTSGSFGPSVGNAIALAYIAAEEAGAPEYTIRAARAELTAKAVPLPFYPGGTARAAVV